jgi:hypothetical protein
MRLLYTTSDGKLGWTGDLIGDKIPRYAILSHTWLEEEVTFEDLKNLGNAKGPDAESKLGYVKLRFCAQQAKRDGLDYFWVDTCCIDKTNSAELQEAINSMFRWYQNAERCYVYLPDVETSALDIDGEQGRVWESAFRKSRWFTRGWTLQELLAPRCVEFFSREGVRLGDKTSLMHAIHETTRVPINALQGRQLSEFSVIERFSWTANRQTTREEDGAYCLLGIFGIYMSLIYGEGKNNAIKRLQKELRESSEDVGHAVVNDTKSQEEWRSKMCSWLTAPDPSTNFYKAQKQCQPDTGLWLLESTKFMEWKAAPASLLWLYGIPGCGKTILSSTIVEHLLQHCAGPDIATVYFYFDFNDIQKQNTELMLRSMLCQLLQRLATTQKGLDTLFLSCEKGLRQPSLHALLEATRPMLLDFAHVYFVIDALDECTQRSELMSLLEAVNGWQLQNLHVLMTSRKERDIENSLEDYVNKENTICLQSDIVDRDIQRYVRQRLSNDKSLAKWKKNPVIRQEVEAALMHGARGMYLYLPQD